MTKYFCDKCEKEIPGYGRNIITFGFSNERDKTIRLELCEKCREELKQLLNNFIK